MSLNSSPACNSETTPALSRSNSCHAPPNLERHYNISPTISQRPRSGGHSTNEYVTQSVTGNQSSITQGNLMGSNYEENNKKRSILRDHGSYSVKQSRSRDYSPANSYHSIMGELSFVNGSNLNIGNDGGGLNNFHGSSISSSPYSTNPQYPTYSAYTPGFNDNNSQHVAKNSEEPNTTQFNSQRMITYPLDTSPHSFYVELNCGDTRSESSNSSPTLCLELKSSLPNPTDSNTLTNEKEDLDIESIEVYADGMQYNVAVILRQFIIIWKQIKSLEPKSLSTKLNTELQSLYTLGSKNDMKMIYDDILCGTNNDEQIIIYKGFKLLYLYFKLLTLYYLLVLTPPNTPKPRRMCITASSFPYVIDEAGVKLQDHKVHSLPQTPLEFVALSHIPKEIELEQLWNRVVELVTVDRFYQCDDENVLMDLVTRDESTTDTKTMTTLVRLSYNNPHCFTSDELTKSQREQTNVLIKRITKKDDLGNFKTGAEKRFGPSVVDYGSNGGNNGMDILPKNIPHVYHGGPNSKLEHRYYNNNMSSANLLKIMKQCDEWYQF